MPGVLRDRGHGADRRRALHPLDTGTSSRRSVYFLTIDKAKFRKPVVPGDVLEYHMTRIERRKNMWWFRGEAKVGSEIVAEAELGAMIADA